ncbi:MAG: CarD family transcriptional regulator [Microbacteriaceae bacterium]
MNIRVGDTVVYPHHGAVTITAVKDRVVRGETKSYVTMRVHTSELEIQLPADNFDLVGVRAVIDDAGVQRVFAVLQEEIVEEPSNWSRRFKANQEKMASGNVLRVSEVVRDLWRRDGQSGLSAGEKRMLQKARQILVSELALARGLSDEDAAIELERVLSEV